MLVLETEKTRDMEQEDEDREKESMDSFDCCHEGNKETRLQCLLSLSVLDQ